MKHKRMQAGYSITELLIVLVVIAIFSVIGFQGYKAMTASAKSDREISNVQILAGNIRKAWRGSSDFTGISEATLIQRKQVPDKMISGTTLQNAWDGQVTITPTGINGGSNNAFMITENNVPVEACMDLISATAQMFSQIVVGGATVKSPTTPFSQSSLQNGCSSSPDAVVIQLMGT